MSAILTSDIVAVIGAGVMGAGIAQVAAKAGHTVYLYDISEDTIDNGIKQLAEGLSKQVERNKMSAAEREQLLQRIKPITDIKKLSECRLIVEAIFEDIKVKQKLFLELEGVCAENTLLTSNTSSISIALIASVLKRPHNLAGMHFFNPAPVMKLVEIVSSITTAPDVAQTIFATAIAWGKQAVHVKSTPGFIVNRVARPFYAEALRVLEEGGADIATIDAIMRDCGGFRMGPFELMDLIGNDINYAVTASVFTAYYNDQRFQPSLIQKELVDSGLLGRKTGHGFYDYQNTDKEQDIKTVEATSIPLTIVACGDAGVEQPLIDLIKENNLTYEIRQSDSFKFIVNDAVIALTDGRTATERSANEAINDLILFDLALDYGTSKRILISPADQASSTATATATVFFNAIGKSVSIIDDVPGLLLMRTVCMLANEGADAVNQQVCDAKAVDTAMQYGVNYPLGPLAWAEQIGLAYVVNVLANLARIYGEDRYRISPLLQRKVHARGALYDR